MSVESKIQELLEQAENLENSSEDLSLTEEDLELFSEEELNELIENMDQLDELSKATLASYSNRALNDVRNSNQAKIRWKAASETGKLSDQEKAWKAKHERIAKTREKGVRGAIKRLTKEDLELFSEEELNELIENMDQLDELSKQTIAKYYAKASTEQDRRANKYKADQDYLNQQRYDSDRLDPSDIDYKEGTMKKDKIKLDARTKGVQRSVNRITKEDVDTDNAATLTAKVRAKAKQQDKTDLDDADYENSEHPHGKEYNIKKDASFDKGERTEVMESINLGDLFEGQDLTEEFKDKITTVFEAAVAARVTQELDRVTEELIEANVEEVALFKEGLIENINGYLGYMTEQWMQKNELALERGVKADLFESLVSSMKNVFTEHYITVPEDKFDVLEDIQEELEQMKLRLDESTANNVQLSNTLREISRNMQIDEAAEGLSEIQAEKFRALAENIAYHDEDSFAEKLDIIKENYFSEREQRIERGTIFSDEPVELTEETTQPQLSPEMKAYTQILR